MDVAADLRRVVDMLGSPRMEDQGRILGIWPLLDDLRTNVTHFQVNADMGNLYRMRAVVARLRSVLEAALSRRPAARTGACLHGQVLALPVLSDLIFRHATARKLRWSLRHFVRLEPSFVGWRPPEAQQQRASGGRLVGGDAAFDRVATLVGRREVVEKLMRALLAGDGEEGEAGPVVLPIVGGPGIGKSRLAQFLLCDDQIKRRFDVRRWVHVTSSSDDDLSHVVNQILAKDDDAENHDMDLTQLALGCRKGYLIVMDDVWNVNSTEWPEWERLMRALPPRGKIILTTRTPSVASRTATIVRTTKPFLLRPLHHGYHPFFLRRWLGLPDQEEEDSRLNPCQGGGGGGSSGSSFPHLVEIGMKLADKCDGVPLLLEYTGSLLGQSKSRVFWEHVLREFDKLPKTVGREPNPVSQSAYASYQHLSSDLRGCFLFCSVFPLNHDFDAEELADLLAGEGFIPPSISESERMGFLHQLLDECFYPVHDSEQDGRLVYRMHRILHIFALSMDYHSRAIIRASQITSSASERSQRTENFSAKYATVLVHPSTESLPVGLLRFKRLKTLILHQEGKIHSSYQQCEIKQIGQVFFQTLRHLEILSLQATKIRKLSNKLVLISRLKYLNLSRTYVEIIPSSVFKLQHLQTLILSHCKKLQKFHASTNNLPRLQKLDLQGCHHLVELPQNISKMKNLEYLNVLECSSLTEMPCGMDQLQKLKTMLGYVVSKNGGSTISELGLLRNLRRLSMTSLDEVADYEEAGNANLQEMEYLESLALQWNSYTEEYSPSGEKVLYFLKPNQCLKILDIVAYDGKNLPIWITCSEPYLNSLVEIRLINITACQTLPPLGLLPCLKTAEISGAQAISCIDDSFCGNNGTFPCLERVILSYMPNLKIWEQAHLEAVFPCLSELVIIQCPKLTTLKQELPSVKKLFLWMNNNMLFSSKESLAGVSKSLKHVSISFCEELLASSDFECLQGLCDLRKLKICGCGELTCLPRGLRHISTIRSLTIDNCSKLEILPYWLENLPFLQRLRLSGCPMLHTIPGDLRRRHGAEIYVENCPNLCL